MSTLGSRTLLGDSSNAVGIEDGVAEVTRHILNSTQCMLWGKSAGRCEFSGCNKPLWKSSVTQESVNASQKAHIYSFTRGDPVATREFQRMNSTTSATLCSSATSAIRSWTDRTAAFATQRHFSES